MAYVFIMLILSFESLRLKGKVNNDHTRENTELEFRHV
jgi:hypothetical protein